MIYGFTGSQHGMSNEQAKTFVEFIDANRDSITEFHHGDCIGSDEQAHRVVKRVMGESFSIHIHPPEDESRRAFCCGEFDVEYPPKPYLVRDRVIAEKAQVLVATPREFEEVLRSGTWATIRYAMQNSLVVIIYPDGKMARNEKITGDRIVG